MYYGKEVDVFMPNGLPDNTLKSNGPFGLRMDQWAVQLWLYHGPPFLDLLRQSLSI